MESEFVALNTTVQHAVWLSSLELQFDESYKWVPVIWCDNQPAIAIAKGNEMTTIKRSRFMNVKYMYVRAQNEDGHVDIRFVDSEDNIADLFTKRLPKNPHSELRGYFLEKYEERELPGVPENQDSGPDSD